MCYKKSTKAPLIQLSMFNTSMYVAKVASHHDMNPRIDPHISSLIRRSTIWNLQTWRLCRIAIQYSWRKLSTRYLFSSLHAHRPFGKEMVEREGIGIFFFFGGGALLSLTWHSIITTSSWRASKINSMNNLDSPFNFHVLNESM